MRKGAVGLLQANLNHTRQAQDLFIHNLAERGCGLGVIAEPYRVPVGHPCWVVDPTGFIAMVWRSVPDSPSCSVRERGHGYVAVDWGPISVIDGYVAECIDCGL